MGSVKYAVDTSVAVAMLDESHEFHEPCRKIAVAERPMLSGHAVFETYSVLTRLPGSALVDPSLVINLLDRAFPQRCWLDSDQQQDLLHRFPQHQIAGGMVYDALVGEAARVAECVLLTRDKRAQRVYSSIGVKFEFV